MRGEEILRGFEPERALAGLKREAASLALCGAQAGRGTVFGPTDPTVKGSSSLRNRFQLVASTLLLNVAANVRVLRTSFWQGLEINPGVYPASRSSSGVCDARLSRLWCLDFCANPGPAVLAATFSYVDDAHATRRMSPGRESDSLVKCSAEGFDHLT